MTVVDHREAPRPDDGYFAVGRLDRAMGVLDASTSVAFEGVVEFEGTLDVGALDEAWRRVRDRHPILSSGLGDDRWEPGGSTADLSAAANRLSVRFDHRALDGVAASLVLADLRDAYVGVLAGAAPPPLDPTPRVLECASTPVVPPRDVAALAARAAFRWRRTPASTHRDPAPEPPPVPADGHAVFDVGPALRRLADRRRRMGWSVDAVLVGLLEHAWAEVLGPPDGPSAWMVAVDLRRPLGLRRGIGNFGAVDDVVIEPTDLVGTIDGADREIRAHVDDLVAGTVASTAAPVVEGALAATYERGRRLRHTRSVSNVGVLGDAHDHWGSSRPSRLYFVGPMAHPPYTSFIATGRGAETLVSVRTSPGWLTDDHARRMAEAINGLGAGR